MRMCATDLTVFDDLFLFDQQALPLDSAGAVRSVLPGILVTPAGQGLGSLRRNYARPLYLLMTIILLIACANIAGLLVQRPAGARWVFGWRSGPGARDSCGSC